MDCTKEFIIAAAYILKERNFPDEHRTILKHPSIQDTCGKTDDIYDIRIARHHAEILHQFGKEVDQHTDGFYTSYGRWVDRRQAAQIAMACGQIDKPKYFGGEKLDSSDIF